MSGVACNVGRVDAVALNAQAGPVLGEVLRWLGASKLSGSPDRGRSNGVCHGGKDLNLSYSNGYAKCWVCNRGFDPIGLVTAVLDLDFRQAAKALADFLGWTDSTTPGWHTPRRRPVADGRRRDAVVLWGRFAGRDHGGEAYLGTRRLPARPLPDGLVRFNTGRTGDRWVDERAREGYRVAFAVRRPTGELASVSLRHCGPGKAPSKFGKSPAVAGLPVAGAAICRPEIGLLSTGDSEFSHDELVLVEGGPDALAVTGIFGVAAMERRVPPTWALGLIGKDQAAPVLEAFKEVVRSRVVHIALDTDMAGEAATPAAVAAAWAAGARRVTRMRPPQGKDISAAWEVLRG